MLARLLAADGMTRPVLLRLRVTPKHRSSGSLPIPVTRRARNFVHRSPEHSTSARCLMVSGSTYSVGPGLLLSDCIQTGFRKHAIEWTVANATVRSHAGGCCGTIFATHPVCLAMDREPRCADLGPHAKWCDSSLTAATRARALVASMTLTEKASNMDSHNFGVPRLAVPPNIFSEALHGMCSGCGERTEFPASAGAAAYTSTGCPISFPQVISMRFVES